jgi:uncharacterized protein YbaR (Trm112 family)
VDKWVRDALRCPACRGVLMDGSGELVCRDCLVAYPVRDSIPSLLEGRARPVGEQAL